IERRLVSIGPVQVAIALNGDLSKTCGEVRPEEVLLLRAGATQSLAVDHGTSHVDAAGVMFRERRNVAAVHRGEYRQVRRAVRRLRRLVVGLEHARGNVVQKAPVAAEELTEADRSGARAGAA